MYPTITWLTPHSSPAPTKYIRSMRTACELRRSGASKQAPTFADTTRPRSYGTLPAISGAAGNQGSGGAGTWFTCTTFAGGKPLKYVEEAWL